MQLELLPQPFTVCQVARLSEEDWKSPWAFVAKTDEELSLVCETSRVPSDCICRRDGWRAVRIQGVLDFSLVGILAAILNRLADVQISVFAVSTYNTDYILLQEEGLDRAVRALEKAGHKVQIIGAGGTQA